MKAANLRDELQIYCEVIDCFHPITMNHAQDANKPTGPLPAVKLPRITAMTWMRMVLTHARKTEKRYLVSFVPLHIWLSWNADNYPWWGFGKLQSGYAAI
jgi:hypothetical protein